MKSNKGINFLKIFSVLAIGFYHWFPMDFTGGYLGVNIFLMISGYLSFKGSERRAAAGKAKLLPYYFRRARKIYPAMYICVMFIVGFLALFFKDQLTGIREEVFSILLGYNNWWQLITQESYFTRVASHSLFTHMWYMGVYIQLVAIWPFLHMIYYRLLKPRYGKKAILFFAVLAAASALEMGLLCDPENINRIYYGTDTRAFAFLIGVVVAGIEENKDTVPESLSGRAGRYLFWIMLLITLAAMYLVDGSYAWQYYGGMFVINIFFAVMLYVMNAAGVESGFIIRNRLTQVLGRYSYWIYLWHYPLIFIFSHLIA